VDKVDLHLHTTASDGTETPRDVVKKAAESNIRAIAITDHDSVSGIDEALKEGKKHNIEVVPGVEISSYCNDQEIHFLGYYPQIDNFRFLKNLQKMRDDRFSRMQKMIKKLKAIGININFSEVCQEAKESALGRPHLARVLIKKGYVKDFTEAFTKFLGKGKPAYVQRKKLSPAKAITLILKAGGVPVLAHPGLYKNDSLIRQFIKDGLRGIEVFHPIHSRWETIRYKLIARYYNLLITGGSDYHGKGEQFSTIGEPPVSYRNLQLLKKEIKK
jgi:predicted metal-dependent phosphoesterase TrpH